MTDRPFRPFRRYASLIPGRFLFAALLVAVSLASSHRGSAVISSATRSDLSGNPATADDAPAEDLTGFAPGLLPGGRAGLFCPLSLRTAGGGGPVCTLYVYSADLPGTGDLRIGDSRNGCPLGCMTDGTADTVKAAQIRDLMAGGRFSVQDTVPAAALQPVTWDVAYAAGTSGYNTRTGALERSGYDIPIIHVVVDKAAHYLPAVEHSEWTPDPVVEFRQFESLAESGPAFGFIPEKPRISEVSIPEPGVAGVMGGAMLLVAFLIRFCGR